MVKERTTSTLRSVTLAAALIGVLVGLPLTLRIPGSVDSPEPGGIQRGDRTYSFAEGPPGDVEDRSNQVPAVLAGITDDLQRYERPAAEDLSDRAVRVVGVFGPDFRPVALYERLPDWGDSEALAFDPHVPGRYVSIGWFEGRPGEPPTLSASRGDIVQVEGVEILVVKDFDGVSLGFRVGTTDMHFMVAAAVPMARVEEAEQGEIAEWMLSFVGGLIDALAADG